MFIKISSTNGKLFVFPCSYPAYYSPMALEGQNPEYVLQTLARLRQLIADDDLEK